MAISSTAAKFRKTGDTLDFTAGADVSAGALITSCGLICMALSPIAKGETAALKILHRGEVVEVSTNEAIGTMVAGVAVYVTAAGLVTKTADGNTLLGYTRAAVGASDLSFEVVCA